MLRRAPPEVPEISAFDMTPMIDITFQLIIFFMLIMDMSSTTHQKLDQPSARHAIKLIEADEVVVNVEADGKLKVFGKVVSGLDVVQKIGHVPTDANDRPRTPVVINKVTIEKS